jgi:hypothetical protein
MRVEHRKLLSGDVSDIPVGYIVRTPQGATMYSEYAPVKWALHNPVLRDRYKVVRFNKPDVIRYVYEERK